MVKNKQPTFCMNLIFFSLIFFNAYVRELLTLLEWQNEKKVPEIQDTAIYNALLRVEKAAYKSSTWELCGKDDDGPLITLSTFEVSSNCPVPLLYGTYFNNLFKHWPLIQFLSRSKTFLMPCKTFLSRA